MSLTFASDNVDTLDTNLNLDLVNVSEWLTANKLTLNTSKTEFMLIGSRQRLGLLPNSPAFVINDAPIKQVSSIKALGVVIDQNLTWKDQIDELAKKIASGIGALKRARDFVPFETLITIYNSLIQPYFDYCNEVWGNCGKTLATKLQKLQNRAPRIITRSNYDSDADSILETLKWPKT